MPESVVMAVIRDNPRDEWMSAYVVMKIQDFKQLIAKTSATEDGLNDHKTPVLRVDRKVSEV
jgi:hypothetical protein